MDNVRIVEENRGGNLRIDLHVHSCYSYDCLMKPEKIIEAAKRRGLVGVAVVDHDTVRGGLEARDRNRHRDFLVIPGAEIKTPAGEVIGLFLEKEIKSRAVDEVVDEIHSQGGIAVLPHPWIFSCDYSSILPKVDGVEMFNARYGRWEMYQNLSSALRSGIVGVGGSDAHFYGEIGNGFTRFSCLLSAAAIKNALRAGEVSSGGKASLKKYIAGSQLIKAYKLKKLPATKGIMRFLFNR